MSETTTPSVKTIASVVATLRQQSTTKLDLAVRLHDHVRDDIAFGFTKRHDTATPSYTLDRQLGHCTPKSDLFCALLREAGFDDATVVTVPIPGDVLHHLGANEESSPFPSRLQHSFTEVTVEGKKCRVDSYTVDPPLFRGAMQKLKARNLSAGYGIHSEGTMDWNGEGDAFVQYVKSTQTPDLERRVPSSKEVVGMPGYLHSSLTTLLAVPLVNLGVGSLLENSNIHIEALRDYEMEN